MASTAETSDVRDDSGKMSGIKLTYKYERSGGSSSGCPKVTTSIDFVCNPSADEEVSVCVSERRGEGEREEGRRGIGGRNGGGGKKGRCVIIICRVDVNVYACTCTFYCRLGHTLCPVEMRKTPVITPSPGTPHPLALSNQKSPTPAKSTRLVASPSTSHLLAFKTLHYHCR